VAEDLRERMRTLATTAPIPYRRQNGGDYLLPSLQLRADLGDPDATGFALHLDGAGAAGHAACTNGQPQQRGDETDKAEMGH
jgi:NAD(P)H dehydrogenase (quinone)